MERQGKESGARKHDEGGVLLTRTDCAALEIDALPWGLQLSIADVDSVRNAWDVLACIRFSGNPEIDLGQLGEHLEQVLECKIHVIGDLLLISNLARAKGPSYTDGLIHHEQVDLGVPRVGIIRQRGGIDDRPVWSQFTKSTIK